MIGRPDLIRRNRLRPNFWFVPDLEFPGTWGLLEFEGRNSVPGMYLLPSLKCTRGSTLSVSSTTAPYNHRSAS